MITPVSGQTPVVKRRERRALSETGKMKVPKIPGYYTRFINTSSRHHPTKLQDYRDAWYEPVTREELFGKECENPNAPYTIGDPDEPMLVKIPEDIHAEDVRQMHAQNELIQKARVNHREGGQYGKVSISDTQ
jgi:hypothetical protein